MAWQGADSGTLWKDELEKQRLSHYRQPEQVVCVRGLSSTETEGGPQVQRQPWQFNKTLLCCSFRTL